MNYTLNDYYRLAKYENKLFKSKSNPSFGIKVKFDPMGSWYTFSPENEH